MLGLSDTTLGAIVSVLLHTGVVVAFLGPLGEGHGAGPQIVMVSIDGLAVTDGKDLAQPPLMAPVLAVRNADQPPWRDRVPAVRNTQQPQFPLTTQNQYPQPPVHNPSKSTAQTIQQPEPASISNTQGGGGLLGSLYSQPRLISLPKPAYPPTARSRGLEGKVGIRVSITAQGNVERADVAQSSGVESFDTTARESALQAQFQPAVQGGVAAPSHKTIIVTFSLLE